VRIQGELRKLGIRVGATSVRRVLRRHGQGPSPRGGPTWTEFLSLYPPIGNRRSSRSA
jgi:hypothetical protein